MATNIEKFVVELGFDSKDIKQLKNLLTLQEKSQRAAKKHNAEERKATAQELALRRKKLHMEKTILKAKKEGLDTKLHEKSYKAAKKIETVENRRLDLEEEILAVKRKQTREQAKQASKPKPSAVKKEPEFKHSGKFSSLDKRDADIYRRVTGPMTRAGIDPSVIKSLEKQARVTYSSELGTQKLADQVKQYIKVERDRARAVRSSNFAMKSMNDSTRHAIRSYVSLFAVLGATNSITRVGQQFQSMESAMLTATGTSEAAAKEIKFLDELTDELGMSLLDTSDAYTKFLFAAKGKLDIEQTRELFTGLSELGTTLSISKERMKLSMNAISQMMNKGKITSEELKLQLAESLPGAIQLFARAVGKSESELFKMMENGQLLAEEVLPKVAKEMKAVASVGLELQKDSFKVAKGQFFKELESAQNTIFEAGFEEGLKDLLLFLKDFLKNNEDALEGMGQFFRAFFNMTRAVLSFVLPVLDALIYILGTVSEAFNNIFFDGATENILAIATAVWAIVTASKALNSALKTQVGLRAASLLLNPAVLIGGAAALVGEDAIKSLRNPDADTGLNAMGFGKWYGLLTANETEGGAGGFIDQWVEKDRERMRDLGVVNVNISTEDGLEGRIKTVVDRNNVEAKVEESH